jgi:hypothetical protein
VGSSPQEIVELVEERAAEFEWRQAGKQAT